MKEEASEPNGNEKHIYRRILSWCGEHKMKIIPVVVLGIVLVGAIYFSDTDEVPIGLTAHFSPSTIIGDGGTSILNVEINPKQNISETTAIQIDIIPSNFSVLRIEKEGLQKFGDRYRYLVPQQKRYKGDKFTTTFNVTATCGCESGTWSTDIRVAVGDYVGESEIPFIVAEKKPSNGFCLGTAFTTALVLLGILANKRER